LPKAIAEATQLFMGLELYWDAFQELNTCRGAGMGLSPIPWTAMMDYARAYEFDEDQIDDLVFFVREMDSAFIEWYEKHGSKQKS